MSWLRVTLITALIAVVTLPAGLLTGLSVGWMAGIVVFLVGWFLLVPVLPIVYMLVRTRGRDRAVPDFERDRSPVEALKRQYAAGEIDETTFERRLERLLERDSPDGEDSVAAGLGDGERESEVDRSTPGRSS